MDQHISAAPFPPFSRFKPRITECLSALHSLPYFIQYLEYCKSIKLLHFLFACQTFREVCEKDKPVFEYNIGSPTKSIKSNLQHDALDIYVKFISMNAPHSITLPENIRRSIENQISTEDGKIDYTCFDAAVSHVTQCLSTSFLPKFHKSSYCSSYKLDVIRKDVCLADVLICESSMVYFLEYLEQHGNENHVLFWISVETFQQHLRRGGEGGEGRGCSVEEVGGDAITLYDTYLSLQARKPVNYGRIIRGIVESSISPDDGIITPDAFLIAQQFCYHFMDKYFMEGFLKSDQFKRYKRELCKELEIQRKEEFNIRSASATRSPITSDEIVSKMETLVVSPDQPSSDPVQANKQSPSSQHRDNSAVPSERDVPLSTDGIDSTPPSVDGINSTPPSIDGKTSAPPSIDGKASAPLSVDGKASAPLSVDGKTSAPPSVDGKTSAPPSVDGKASVALSVDGMDTPVSRGSPSLDRKQGWLPKRSPSSSYRSSPTSSKHNSPRINSKRDHSSGGEPGVAGGLVDILDDTKFWNMPRSDYTLSAVDQWGVYQTEDQHLLNSPAQGSDKIKKSVLKLFGKEEISEEEAVEQAKSIVSDVMNFTANPTDWQGLVLDE